MVADSDEHTPDGHLTEDLTIRTQMVRKRLAKFAGIQGAVVPSSLTGAADPDLLLVCWGSTWGAAQEACELVAAEGTRAAVLHFAQVWPLVPDQFLPVLQKARRVVAVEGNATAQFARLIRRETGFHVRETVLRYDGLPITPEYILAGLQSGAGGKGGG